MLKPLGDRVVLKVQKEEEQSIGGIVIASNAKEKPTTGEVIAVGNGRILDNGQRVEPEVKVGQSVVFDKYAGSEVKYEGEEYLVIRENDIIAVVD
ncbi:co-chaperone GroES [Ligilactobacillus salivarius]|uniref:Co-chaperonin GroES n=1 Tax=Ligilactobacillus salivarius TaxID=1624 RepID=A0ABD6XJL4_9LACO|nr:co-chaperone GroES [Ligilactobacillus salivarius]ATP36799.1 co-chaperone GroES [Ligilactobacillus salivarius]KRM70700.1 molecular chaperone GroES [Ligilactobacillus salivarius DSM 20555 = ATCC 11741]MBE7937748.1 co-chaperone GroES [Ligilactobacillus salivarius]MDG9754834.1 co-chaperone GroES [Ligilactobacillus salivarius]MDQ4442344.1 co-chaperone GroES [Ligilactobacillus salivarius]